MAAAVVGLAMAVVEQAGVVAAMLVVSGTGAELFEGEGAATVEGPSACRWVVIGGDERVVAMLLS